MINGIVTGSIYALIALGYALVYNTTRIFHIAYSVIYVIAPYLVFTFLNKFSFTIIFSSVIALIVVGLISIIIELIIYQPLHRRNSSPNIILISSLGVMIIGVNIIALFYGNETKLLNTNFSKSIEIGNYIITITQLIQLLLSILLVLVFFLFLKFSKFGLTTRALRDNSLLCRLYALDIKRLRIKLFFLSALFAGLGGILTAYDVGMDPHVGLTSLINAVVALIIGGIGNFYAPVLGGYILGILQALTVWQFSANWQDAITFTVLIIFLVFRPQGIMGEKRRMV